MGCVAKSTPVCSVPEYSFLNGIKRLKFFLFFRFFVGFFFLSENE